jgi:hypothetical protein
MLINFLYNDINPIENYLQSTLAVEKYGSLTIKGELNKNKVRRLTENQRNINFYHIQNVNDIKMFDKEIDADITIVLNSNMFITDDEAFKNILQRIVLVEKNIVFPSKDDSEFLHFPFFALNKFKASAERLFNLMAFEQNPSSFISNNLSTYEEFELPNSIVHIDTFDSYIRFYQTQRKSRYFNQLKNSGDIVNKSSKNVQKLKAEFEYYYLIPNEMQRFFVQPFNFTSNESSSSYSMQLYHVPDVALLWINQSLKIRNFKNLMSKVFIYLKSRPIKNEDNHKYNKYYLYRTKLIDRVNEFKELDSYKKINTILENSFDGKNLEKILEKFLLLFKLHTDKFKLNKVALSHGDLCFSNILYHQETNFLKFIDPRGGMVVEDLYFDEYYDLAKLSHSILGGYDFILDDRYSLEIGDNLKVQLNNPGFEINQDQKKIFISMLKENGYDYTLVRLYEASLFISMLPLHYNDLNRLISFIITADKILDEANDHSNK